MNLLSFIAAPDTKAYVAFASGMGMIGVLIYSGHPEDIMTACTGFGLVAAVFLGHDYADSKAQQSVADSTVAAQINSITAQIPR